MVRSSGFRYAAGVLGLLGSALALVMALVMILFGGVLGAIDSSSGHSLLAGGGLLFVFSIAAISVSAAFFFIPSGRFVAICLALLTGAVLWSLAWVDAVGWAIPPVTLMCVAVLAGLMAGPKASPDATS
ncbi:MAG: hypothetical protein ABI577_14735 [bacterium]